jgi:hypothetical protein
MNPWWYASVFEIAVYINTHAPRGSLAHNVCAYVHYKCACEWRWWCSDTSVPWGADRMRSTRDGGRGSPYGIVSAGHPQVYTWRSDTRVHVTQWYKWTCKWYSDTSAPTRPWALIRKTETHERVGAIIPTRPTVYNQNRGLSGQVSRQALVRSYVKIKPII